MPNPGADAPLRKVTLNLYEEDCQVLELFYGHGWSAQVREVIQNFVCGLEQGSRKQTIGDLNG